MKRHLKIIMSLLTAILFASILSSAVDPLYAGTVFKVTTLGALFFAFFVVLPQGSLGQTPAATAGPYSAAYISLQDIGKPEWYAKLVASRGDQGIEFIGMINAMGWNADATAGTELVQHWEDDWIWDNFMVEAQAGGGTTATLTIAATSIRDGRFFPGVNDIIEFPNKDGAGNPIQAIVTAIGANTINVTVGKSTWLIPATSASQELFVGTNLSAEGTGQPASKRTSFNLFQNSFVRVKDSVELTGDAMTTKFKWDEYELANGKKITGAIGRATFEMDIKLMIKEQYAFLSAQKYDNITGIVGMEGMFPAMNSRAIPFGYTIWGLGAYDAMDKAQRREFAAPVQGMLEAINHQQANRNVMADYLKHTNVDFTTKQSNKYLFGDNADATAMVVDFNYIKYDSKRVYAFKSFDSLINPKQYGSAGYNYEGNFYVIPLKRDNMDPNTKMRIPTMRTIYRSLDGYNRKKEIWPTGSANVAEMGATNDVDNRVFNGRCQMSAEFFAVNQWINGYQN